MRFQIFLPCCYIVGVVLRVEHLYFWQQGQELLKNISFSLSAGDRLGLVGLNGAGKTTLLKLIAGQFNPESGSLQRAAGISFGLFQPPLFSKGSVAEVARQALVEVQRLEQALREEELRIAQGASLEQYNQLSEAFERLGAYQAEANLEKMLELFGLTQLAQDVTTLSGGEQMRLGLAMMLVQRPELLLLDEPTNHLDLAAKKLLAKQLMTYPGTLIVASHDRAFLDRVCLQTAFLEKGLLKVYKGNYSRAQAQHHPDLSKSIRLNLSTSTLKETQLTASHLHKTIENRVILHDISFRLESGDKIALLGANGSGKTTLLKLLAGEAESDLPFAKVVWHKEARLYYFDQVFKGLEDKPLLEQLTDFVTLDRARMLLALVGIPAPLWLASLARLSPGQRARAGLARMIASEANLLLLDEPTNDLDVQMIELLENTLASGDITCIVVAHDQRLIETVATQCWHIHEGQLQKYASFKEFEQGRLSSETTQLEESVAVLEETPEEKLERLELERVALQEALFDPLMFSERDYQRLRQHLTELEHELSALYDQRYPEPLPQYQAQVNGIVLGANMLHSDIQFVTDLPVTMKLVIQQNIGHLVLKEHEGHCLLEWSRNHLLQALARLCFLYFGVTALQHQSSHQLEGAMFQSAGAGWWVLSRDRFERCEGWVRVQRKHKRHQLKRRKYTKTGDGRQKNAS